LRGVIRLLSAATVDVMRRRREGGPRHGYTGQTRQVLQVRDPIERCD